MGLQASAFTQAAPVCSPLDRWLARAHQTELLYGGLGTVTHVEGYSARGLLTPGTAIIWGAPSRYIDHLRCIRIGAPATGGVMVAKAAPTLLEGLNPIDAQRLRDLIRNGGRIEFFQPTGMELDVVAAMGIDASSVYGPVPAIGDIVNDKADLRKYVERRAPGVNLLEHSILRVTHVESILTRTRQLIHRDNIAVVKFTDQASGDGMFFPNGYNHHWEQELHEAISAFVRKHGLRDRRGRVRRIIVEAYVLNRALSGQLDLREDGPHFLKTTLMRISGTAVHNGNLLSSADELPGIPSWVAVEVERQSMALAWVLWRDGYRGYLGLDFLLTGDAITNPKRVPTGDWPGKLYLAEGNGRVTAGLYPLSVALQAEANGDLSSWGAIWANIFIWDGLEYNYDQLHVLFERTGILLDGVRGVIPAVVSPSDHRANGQTHQKITMCCIGRDQPDAENLLAHAADLIGAVS